MEPWEVMISESQERMVAVVRPQMLAAAQALCDRWELHHAVVGEVTGTGLLRAFWEDELVGEIPARLLTDECPRYRVEPVPRRSQDSLYLAPDAPANARALVELLGSPNIRSRAWIYRQYDHLVGSRTVRRPGSTQPCCGCGPAIAGLPSRSTARAGWRGSTRAPAARSRCSRRRATSPAPAASRSG